MNINLWFMCHFFFEACGPLQENKSKWTSNQNFEKKRHAEWQANSKHNNSSIHTHIHTCMQTCMHKHMHTQTHTHTHSISRTSWRDEFWMRQHSHVHKADRTSPPQEWPSMGDADKPCGSHYHSCRTAISENGEQDKWVSTGKTFHFSFSADDYFPLKWWWFFPHMYGF